MSKNKEKAYTIKKENKINAEIACDIFGIKDRNKFIVLRKYLGERMIADDWKKAFKTESLIK